MNPLSQRIDLLIEQSRYQLAEEELKKLITTNQEDDGLYAKLGICYIHLNKLEEARTVVEKAISLNPGNAYNLCLLGVIHLQVGNIARAEEIAGRITAMEPYNASYFGFMSRVFILKMNWEKALHYAEEGLAIDPENAECLNLRVQCLTKLNRKEEASQSIEGVLSEHPDDSFTHSNVGWSLLENGNSKKALAHFGEALRLDPSNDYARSGLVEALKAKNIFYRILLNYYFWMAKKQGRSQWVVIIGFVFGTRILRAIAKSNPALEPFIFIILIALGIFTYTTWISGPLFNLFLFTDRMGRNALSDKEKRVSAITGICLALGIISGIVALITTSDIFICMCLYSFGIVIPLAMYFSDTIFIFHPGKKKFYAFILYGLTAFCIINIIALIAGASINFLLLALPLLIIVALTWYTNFLVIR